MPALVAPLTDCLDDAIARYEGDLVFNGLLFTAGGAVGLDGHWFFLPLFIRALVYERTPSYTTPCGSP